MSGYPARPNVPLKVDRPYYQEKHKRTRFGPQAKLPKPLKSGLGLQPDSLVARLAQQDMTQFTAEQNYGKVVQARMQHMLKQKQTTS